MRSTITTAAAAATFAAAVLALSACSSGGASAGTSHTPGAASTSACEAALVQELQGMFTPGQGAPSPTARPTACAGLDSATVQKLSTQAANTVMNQPIPTQLPTAPPSDFPSFATDFPSAFPTNS